MSRLTRRLGRGLLLLLVLLAGVVRGQAQTQYGIDAEEPASGTVYTGAAFTLMLDGGFPDFTTDGICFVTGPDSTYGTGSATSPPLHASSFSGAATVTIPATTMQRIPVSAFSEYTANAMIFVAPLSGTCATANAESNVVSYAINQYSLYIYGGVASSIPAQQPGFTVNIGGNLPAFSSSTYEVCYNSGAGTSTTPILPDANNNVTVPAGNIQQVTSYPDASSLYLVAASASNPCNPMYADTALDSLPIQAPALQTTSFAALAQKNPALPLNPNPTQVLALGQDYLANLQTGSPSSYSQLQFSWVGGAQNGTTVDVPGALLSPGGQVLDAYSTPVLLSPAVLAGAPPTPPTGATSVNVEVCNVGMATVCSTAVSYPVAPISSMSGSMATATLTPTPTQPVSVTATFGPPDSAQPNIFIPTISGAPSGSASFSVDGGTATSVPLQLMTSTATFAASATDSINSDDPNPANTVQDDVAGGPGARGGKQRPPTPPRRSDTPSGEYTGGNSTLIPHVIDFNNDGIPDVVLVDPGNTSIHLMLGTEPRGQFVQEYDISPQGYYSYNDAAFGDLNGDGYPDAVYLQPTYDGNADANLYVALNNQQLDLGFPTYLTTIAGATQVALGHFTGNANRLDAAVLSVPSSGAATITVFSGNGDGTFNTTPYATSNPGFNAGVPLSGLQALDFNQDGFTDLAVVVGTNQTTETGLWFLLNSSGSFSFDGAPAPVSGSTSASFTILPPSKGTNVPSYFISDPGKQQIGIAVNNYPNGQYEPGYTSVPNLQSAAFGDFNGDGTVDAVVYDGTNLSVYLSTYVTGGACYNPSCFPATPSFSSSSSPSASAITSSLSGAQLFAAPDLNGDGYADVLTLSGSTYSGGTGAMTSYMTTGNATASYSAGTLAVGSHTIKAVTNGTLTMLGTTATAVFNVAPPPQPLLTWTTPAAIPYGTALSSTQLDAVATDASTGAAVPGTYAYTPQAGAIPGAGTNTLSVTFTPSNTASYSPVTKTVQLMVNQASPVVTWATPAAIPYGTALSSTQLDATATGVGGAALPGTFAYTPAAGYKPMAGTDTLSVLFTPTDTTDYTTASKTVQLVVTPATSVSTTLTLAANGSALASGSSVAFGTVVSLQAQVTSGGAAVFPGLVTFCNAAAPHCEDTAVFGQAQTTQSESDGGAAVLKVRLPIGTYSIDAIFGKQADYPSSTSSPVTLTVTGTRTVSSVLSSSGTNPYNFTEVLTPSNATPLSGTLSVMDTTDGNSVLGTASLSGVPAVPNFSAGQTISVGGTNAYEVAVTDFNGDGIPDAVFTAESGTVGVYLGDGSGNFTQSAALTFTTPSGVTPGDFNNDGIPDFAVLSGSTQDGTAGVEVYLGNGDGTFQAGINTAAAAGQSLVAGEFNGDGNLDLAFADYSGQIIQVLFGKGDGTFTSGPTIPIADEPYALVVADFNQDGVADLASANNNRSVSVILANGDGTFQTPQTITTPSQDYYAATGDFNGDGYPDILIGSAASGVLLLLNNGSGTGFTLSSVADASGYIEGLAVGDFNNDGRLDFVFGDPSNGPQSLALANGDGTFTVTSKGGTLARSLVAADLTGNGIPDLVAVSNTPEALYVLKNTQTRTVQVSGTQVIGNGTHLVDGVLPADSNYPANTSNTVAVAASSAPATTVTVTSTSVAYGTASTELTARVAYAGVPPTGGLSFTIDSGATVAASCAGTASPLTCTASYPTSTLTAGSHTITATEAADANYALSSGTGTLTVTGIGTTVTVTSQSITYGTATAALSARVAYSGTAAPTGALTFRVDSGAVVTGTCTGTASPLTCTATYSTSTLTAGSHTITATDAADADYTLSSGSGTLTVTATGTTVTVAPQSIAYGTATATLSASVAYTGTAAPTGAVTFRVDSGASVTGTCSGTASPLTCTASYPTSSLTAGSHTITATDAADADYTASTGTGSLTVTAAGTTVTVASQTITYGTATAAVSANVAYTGATAPTGALTFRVDTGAVVTGTCTGTASPLTCTATYSTATLTAGSHTITATDAEDANYTLSSGSGSLTVTGVGTTVTVAPQTIAYGTATAALSANVAYTGATAPTGALTFRVDTGAVVTGTCTGTASPLTCTATYSTATLTAGSHTITATDAADANYTASTGTGSLTVTGVGTTVTVAPQTIAYGTAAAALTASVAYSGSVAPTGALTFRVDSAAAVTGTCSGTASPLTCTASYSTSSLTAGSHTITATVAADANYTASTGAGSLTVTATGTTVTVASQTITYGTATATLSANVAYTGATAPTGALTFRVDTGASVTGTCSGTASPLTCTAAYSTATLTAGSHTITATDAADANYTVSTGTGSLTVTGVGTTVTVAPQTITYGTATATLSANVAYTGATAPTGALTFRVDTGASVTGTCTGTASPLTCTATYSTSSLTAGSHTITATNAADANYTVSTGTGSLTVTGVGTIVTVAPQSITYGTATATLSASVAYTGTAAPTGALTFRVDTGASVTGTCSGTASPLTCTAAYSTATLTAGSHTITATDAADADYTVSTGTGSLTVTATGTTVTVASQTITYGTATATLSANVAYTGATAPTGALTFRVDTGASVTGTCTGTASPLTCTATYSTSSLTAGSHTITATNAADANYTVSTGTGSLTVTGVGTIVTVAPQSITYGTATATLSASVAYTGTAAPTGALTFRVDSGASVTGTCSGTASPLTCTASYSTSSLTAGSHTIIATDAADADYTVSAGTGTLTVSQTAPTVMWATPASIPYGTALSAAQLNATASVPGTFAYTPAAGSIPAAGTDTLSVVFTPTDTTDYSSVTKTVQLVVSQATATVSWATPAPITFGTALSATQLNATASVSGTFAYTPAAGAILAAGTHTLSVVFTPTNTTDYSTVTQTVQLVVNQASPVLTWATPAPITFGTALSSTQLNATASIPGTFAYTPAAGAVLPAGTQTLSATFTPTDATDYSTATKTVQLVVSQAAATVTWATPAPITFGTALSATQLNATASVPGTFAYTPAAGTVPGAGTQTLSVLFTPTDATDYGSITKTVQLLVSKATPVVNWATPAPIAQGTALSATQLNATSAVPGTFAYTPPAGTVLNAGTQTISVLFTPTDAADYNTVTQTVSIVVNKGTSTLTWATPAAITYGTALSATQLDASSTIPGTFSYTPAAGSVPTAGTQTLSVLFTPNDTTNYSAVTQTVELVVNKATPSVAWATPAPIAQGTALSATQLDATATGVSGAVLPGNFAYTPAAGTVPNAGAQTLSVLFTPTDTTDYGTVTQTVQLVVNKSTPTVSWATPAAITYGTALSATQLNASSTLPGTFTYTPAAGTVPGAGSQTLSVLFTPTNAANANTVTQTVTLVVNQATPVVTWPAPAAINQGTALSATQLDATAASVTGAALPGTFTYTPAAGTVLNAGQQTLSVVFAPTDSVDYKSATQTTALVVNKPQTPAVTWATPAAIAYGTVLSAAQLNASSTIPGTFTYTPAAGTILPAGTQTLSVLFTPTDRETYTTVTQTVQLVVTKATPTVTWATPAGILYGTALSAAQLNATSSVPGTLAYTPALGTLLSAGTQTLSVTFTPTDAADYGAVTQAVQLVVAKASPVLTWATPAAIVDGTALSATQLDATAAGVTGAALPGVFTYTPPAGSVPAAGTQTLSVLFTPTDGIDYNTATKAVQLVVNNPATTGVLTSSANPSQYGQPVTLSLTLTPSATVPGSVPTGPVALRDGNTTIQTANLVNGAVTFSVSTLTAGNHALTAVYNGDGTYGASTTPVLTQAVSQISPAITWIPTASTITYGTALSAAQLDATAATLYTASVPGTAVYTPALGTVLTGGTKTLSVTFTPTDTLDFAAVTKTISIIVAKAAPVLTWPTPAGVVVGTPLSSAQLDATAAGVTGAALPGAFVYTPAAGTPATGGPQTLSVLFTPTDTIDYLSQTAQVTLNGTALSLTAISPNTALLGDPAKTITLTGTGFLKTSVAQVNGAAIPTTYVSSTALTAIVPASAFLVAGNLGVTVADPQQSQLSTALTLTVSPPPVPVTFNPPATPPGPDQQPSASVTLTNPYPVDLVATITLTFTPADGEPTDPNVQFAQGGTTLTFTIPANSTLVPDIQFQTGTIAGTITLTLNLTAGGANVTPTTLAPIVIALPQTVPGITANSVSFVQHGADISVTMTGYTNTLEITSAKFHFTGSGDISLANPDVTVNAGPDFATWYSSGLSGPYGSAFTYTQPFTLSEVTPISQVTVTLSNTIGASEPVSSPLQ